MILEALQQRPVYRTTGEWSTRIKSHFWLSFIMASSTSSAPPTLRSVSIMVATASEESLLLDSDACPSSSPPATTRSSGRPALRVEPSSCNCNLPRLPSTFALPLPSSFSFFSLSVTMFVRVSATSPPVRPRDLSSSLFPSHW
ncbi:hypothetical protein Syun_025931 [Stephania yunnanensis]|uniref:Uncharacterized protein n=1 Tax=Stephania yunnanensis TaxID=152371 RepID=A0AAP0ESL8_9MAGN